MTGDAGSTTLKLPGTPKPWMNKAVAFMLRTPGVRSVLGRTFMILTVTGAKTGRRYTTPVQFVRDGDRMIVLSQRKRRWWRNIPSQPSVEMVLKGDTVIGSAHVAEGGEALEAIATCLRVNPRVAEFYGITIDEDGEPDPDGVQRLHEASAAIIIRRAY